MAVNASSASFDDNYKMIRKQAFQIKTSRQDGLLLQIHHTVPDRQRLMKTIKFSFVAFDDTGEQIAAANQSGNIFIIDFSCFRFWMLPTFEKCSVLVYSTYRKNEILVGKLDGTIHFVHTELGNLSGVLIGHKEPVSQITFTSGQPYCLSVSATEAIIWDLSSNSKLHQLSLHSNIKHKQVVFTPVSNKILAFFEDNTIHVWKFETFYCVKYCLPSKWQGNNVASIAVTRDGGTVAIAGNSSSVLLMSLNDWKLKKILQLPKYINKVQHLEFLSQPFDGGSSKIIAILTSKLSVLIFNIETSQILTSVSLQGSKTVNKFTCSSNGKYLITLLTTGELNVYGCSKLLDSRFSSKSSSTLEIRQDSTTNRKVHCRQTSYREQNRAKTKQQSTLLLTDLQKKLDTVLDVGRLRPLLMEFGEYPEDYRLLIWKSILQLPQNQIAYNALVNKGWHPACKIVDEAFPDIKNSYFSNSVKRLISCLSYWSPLFSQVTYLPKLIFPFVKVFKSDQFACFEVVSTFIVNWCQRWYEFFPFPPLNVLSMVENVLSDWDEELFNWFTENRITSHQYGWTLLQTAFSEVFTDKEWLQLFDHILSNEPMFIIFAVVSYNIMGRSTLLNIVEPKDFDFFFHNQTAIDMKRFIRKTYVLYNETIDDDCHPKNYFNPFRPLISGETYQVYNEYPKFVVDKQANQINSIKIELNELLKEQSRLSRARAEQEKKHAIEINKQTQKLQLIELQKKYKDALKEDEERIAEYHKKVGLLKKDLRRREIDQIEETRDRIQQQVTQQRTAALETLLLELERNRAEDERKLKEIEEETRERHQQLTAQKQLLNEQLELLEEAPFEIAADHAEIKKQHERLVEEIAKIRENNSFMRGNKDLKMSGQLAAAGDLLEKAEFELAQEAGQRQRELIYAQHNIQAMELEAETKGLQEEVNGLLNNLVEKQLHESWQVLKAAKESKEERQFLQDEQLKISDLAKETSSVSTDQDFDIASTSVAYYAGTSNLIDPSIAHNKTNEGRDLYRRDADFYKKEQAAIRSSMDVRKQLLTVNRRKPPSHSK